MADQPEALRLADVLDGFARDKGLFGVAAAAAILRQQHDLLGTANALCRIRAAEIDRLKAANLKLAGAIDMIRETLQGGNVDDLLYIINTALDEHRRNHG